MAERGPQRPALRFTALDLRRFLGLQRRDQALRFGAGDLSPAVTLIAGPNGSGKTTTARAIEAVLWPETSPDPLADVVAALTAADASWTAELAGTRRRWLREGLPVAGPVYCPAADRDRYRLSLHELLTADDRELAAGIRRELGGGYSLADAVQTLGFSAEPSIPRKGSQRLKQAVEAVAAATREQADLRRREGELALLRVQESEAQEAVRLLQVATCLENWRLAGRRLVAARRQLTSYDPRIASLRGKELEQWRDLQKRQAQAEAARRNAAEALHEAETALARRLAQRPVLPPEVLGRCRALGVQLQQAENDARNAAVQLLGAQAREETARAALAERLDEQQLARLDRLQPDEELAEAVRAAAGAAIASGVRERFGGLPALAEPPPEPAALETCRRGLDLLRAWLQESPAVAPSAAPAPTRVPFLVAIVTAVLTLVAAPLLHWALLLPGLCLVFLAWCLRPRLVSPAPVSRRPDLEAEYGRLGLATPSAWAPDPVARTLEELALRWSRDSARGRLLNEGMAVRTALERDSQDRARDLQSCRERIASRLGCVLDETPLAVFHLVSRIAAWQDARDALAEARRSAVAADEAAAALRARLVSDLAPSGTEPPADGAAAAALVEGLEKERARYEAEVRERDRLAHDLTQETRSLADIAERRRDLLRVVGLRADEEDHVEEVLRQWTALLPAVAQAAAEERTAAAAVERSRAEALRTGVRHGGLQTLRSPALAQRRDELERAALRREQLLRDIESTETLVREARRRHDLEQRLGERDAALTELARERDAGWRALAGQCCVERVAAGLELQSSGVLRRAQELFAAITCGRYRLLADETRDGALFRARDTETDAVHDLTSLSSGTRLQLLLAARLAFIAEKEGDGLMLPLVLDEVLGNSDDARAATIVDAVIAAARAGRQVFCLSAQADEVGKWQTRLLQAGVDVAVCWLPRGSAPPPAVELTPVLAPAIPAPLSGETALDYARRLGVPALDAFAAEVGNLHLWYLVDELPALHALLRAGYRTWGPLALFLSQGGIPATLAPDVPEMARLSPTRLAARAEMVMLVLSLTRVGRGRPLDRAGLQSTGIVTDRYAEEVAQLLDRAGGQAVEVLRRLDAGEVRGFRRRSIEELAQWLRERGYIDDRPPLSLDEIRARLHAGATAHLASGALTMSDLHAVLRLAEPPAPPAAAAATPSPPPAHEVTP